MPELEFELSTGNLKPGVAALHRQAYNWKEDIIRFPSPPITAAVASKIRKQYFPAGVESSWLVIPAIKTIHLFLLGQPVIPTAAGILHDSASGIDLDVAELFR